MRGVLKSTTYGVSVRVLLAELGIIPCVRRWRFALERTPKVRVQPGNPHGKAVRANKSTNQGPIKLCVAC